MNNIIKLALSGMILPSVIYAQERPTQYFYTKQICANVLVALDSAAQFGETLLFTGSGYTVNLEEVPFLGGMFFFVNQDTGTFSIISIYEDGTACLVLSGEGFAPYTGPQ
jgi:hypothetical protein